MTLRVARACSFTTRADLCPVCEARLIPYLPRCSRCKAELPCDAGISPRPAGDSGLGAHSELSGDAKAPPARAARSAGTVRLGHLTDIHIGDSPQGNKGPSRFEVLSWWFDELRRSEVDVIVISGDLVQKGNDERSLTLVREQLDRSGVPWCVVPGNHDVPQPGELDYFRAIFGRYPRVESRGGAACILLDSNAGIPPDERGIYDRNVAILERKIGTCITEGRVGGEQLEQAARLLEKRGEPRVLVLHHHLVPQEPERTPVYFKEDLLGTMGVLQDAAAVTAWAAKHSVRLVLHGHKHVMMRAGVHQGGLLVLNGGNSTNGPPYRARLIDLDPEGQRRVYDVEMMK